MSTENRSHPQVVDLATFQAELDALRVEEKAHMRAGDALAASRRRLPMVEVDASSALVGPQGHHAHATVSRSGRSRHAEPRQRAGRTRRGQRPAFNI